jgi:hypothetical protein
MESFLLPSSALADKCVADSSVAAANDGVKVDAKLNSLFTDNMVLLRRCWAE